MSHISISVKVVKLFRPAFRWSMVLSPLPRLYLLLLLLLWWYLRCTGCQVNQPIRTVETKPIMIGYRRTVVMTVGDVGQVRTGKLSLRRELVGRVSKVVQLFSSKSCDNRLRNVLLNVMFDTAVKLNLVINQWMYQVQFFHRAPHVHVHQRFAPVLQILLEPFGWLRSCSLVWSAPLPHVLSAGPLNAMVLRRGQSIMIQYQQDGHWFERVIVLHLEGSEYWVVSANYELFQLTLKSPPLKGMRLLPPSRELPAALQDQTVEMVTTDSRLGFFSEEELVSFEDEARLLSDLPQINEVEGHPDGSQPKLEASVFKGPVPVDGYVWVVAQPPPGSSLEIGTVLNVPSNMPLDGTSCYMQVVNEETAVRCDYLDVEERRSFVEKQMAHARGTAPAADLIGNPRAGDD